MLVNRVVIIPNLKAVIDRINKMGISEKQTEDAQFTDRDRRVEISDLDLNLNDDNDNINNNNNNNNNNNS